MKIKSKIEEKKLTKAELEAREKVMKDLKKNKSALVKRYGKDAEAVMYGRATNIAKKMAESENKTRIKELVRKALMQEGKEFSEEEIQNVMDTFDMTREEAIQHLQQSYSDYKEFDMDEGKKEDVDGDGDIDSKDYLAKRDAAIKKAKGEMKEDIDLGHEDNEPHMIKADLYRIGKYAMELYAMAEELEETGQEIDFPAWWQAMITDAATKMVKAKHYLDFELKEPAIDAAVDALTGEEPHMGEPEPPMMEGEVGKIDKLAAKIAKALKDPKNQDAEDQNNIKQARKAMNDNFIKAAEKIIKPYLDEGLPKGFWDKKMKAKDETNESYETLKKKIEKQGKSAKAAGAIAGAIASYKAKGGGKGPTAKQVKEVIGRNYPEELDGEYEGEPQKIKGVDIYDTLIDILNISNSENDFIRKMTDSLTDETNVLPKSSEEKLRNWYKKNVTN